MATAVTSIDFGRRSFADMTRIYLNEARFEFLKNLRLRVYSVSVIAFPVMFYILFGLVLGGRTADGLHPATYLMATYGTFGVIGASLFGTAAGLAADRGLGWLQVKRASPMPPFAYFTAKITMIMLFITLYQLELAGKRLDARLRELREILESRRPSHRPQQIKVTTEVSK